MRRRSAELGFYSVDIPTDLGGGGLSYVGQALLREVAGSTGRSPHTVDTHIRSICRKLECRGRREAIALATSRGWVQT